MPPAHIQPRSSVDPNVGVSAFVIVLAVISVVLRFYMRISTRASLGTDDWLILAAVVATLLAAALILWGMFSLKRVCF